MSDRPTIALPYGGGLDRGTGVAAVEPSRFADLRNVILLEGKAKVRKGHLEVGRVVDDGDADVDVVNGIHPIRQLQTGLAFGYVESTRVTHVNRLTGVGAVAQYVGDWFTADDESGTPRLVFADSYGKVFAAHAEAIYSRRAMSIYYENDVLFGLGPLNPDSSPNADFEGDFDGDGNHDQVKFRGVVNHLKYIFGWGYGTATDPDRGEIVRVCEPGEPLRWRADDYFIAGSGGVPVVCCRPCGEGLAVFKEYERHHIFGYDRANFGIDIAEPYIGCAGDRLAVTVGKICYFWSLQGPRAASGIGPSIDLALPLDLEAPSPTDLVEAGETEDGFAEYLPEERVVLFVFGQRVYCLSIRNPAYPRWSYWELAQPAFCGGILYSGGATGSGEAPSAYMSEVEGEAGP